MSGRLGKEGKRVKLGQGELEYYRVKLAGRAWTQMRERIDVVLERRVPHYIQLAFEQPPRPGECPGSGGQ